MIQLSVFNLLLLVSVSLFAGNPKLASGPMQGHTTPTSTKIWIMVKDAGIASVMLTDTLNNEKHTLILKTAGRYDYKGYVPLTFDFEGLRPNRTYLVTIFVDNQTTEVKRSIKTAKVNPNSDYAFMVTSCALSVPIGLKWLHPGIEDRVYKYAAQKEADFSLWLGDYLYYFPQHTKSKDGMYRRWIYKRTNPRINHFMESYPQYAIWDDHDYGPNDSGYDFVLKDTALSVFQDFFPNPYEEEMPTKGNFFKFAYLDSEFFMTDDRWYRTEDKTDSSLMLGSLQLEWLLKSLKESDAVFKFIGVGSQVLNTCSANECYWYYGGELKQLLNYILDNEISGVIFLTGDRHHSELLKMNFREGDQDYPFYEFTSSGITSFRRRTRRTKEKDNPNRVKHSLADFQNFGRIAITGESGNRDCTFYIYNNRGKLCWEYTVNQHELKINGTHQQRDAKAYRKQVKY